MTGLPEGCLPIFLSSPTQDIFNCKGDEDVTTENPMKIIPREEITKDFYNRGAVSDFTPFKQYILVSGISLYSFILFNNWVKNMCLL